MALNLTDTAGQIDGMASDLKARQSDRERRILSALRGIEDFETQDSEGPDGEPEGTGWAVPVVLEPPGSVFPAQEPPADFTVASADGSQIDADRHLAARCFLINTGVSVLTYGSRADADLSSRPRLYARSDELVIRDPATFREQTIEGAVLGAKRTVEEIRGLVDVVSKLPDETPILALIDGSLLMLGLVGRGYEDFVRQELVEDGFAAALEDLRGLSEARPVAVASYISLPRHFEVVNALRPTVCEFADGACGSVRNGRQSCERCVDGVLDREIFARLLQPGERSGLFMTSSPFVEDHYRGQRICFFYVNVGAEICRVEVPSWVAEDDALLGLAHALVVDQCERGRGYPVGLMEAHEQAVVSGRDRQVFIQLVERALYDQDLPVFTSEKDRSKRLRWL